MSASEGCPADRSARGEQRGGKHAVNSIYDGPTLIYGLIVARLRRTRIRSTWSECDLSKLTQRKRGTESGTESDEVYFPVNATRGSFFTYGQCVKTETTWLYDINLGACRLLYRCGNINRKK